MLNKILAEQNISLDRLNSFLEIIEAGSIADAVDRDPSRQSLYSKHKKDLEQVFGVKLFYQKNKKLTPTEYGKELAAIVRSFEKSLNDLDAKHKKEKSVVSIGAGDSVFQWMLLPVASSLRDTFSSINFSFRNLRTAQIIEGVKDGSIDFGIIRFDAIESGFNVVKLRTVEFSLYYQSEDGKDDDLEELLSNRNLIGLSGNGSYVKKVQTLQQTHGVDTGFWIQLDSLPMVENSIIETGASAILPNKSGDILEKVGFKMIGGKQFKAFSRVYCLISKTGNLGIRPNLKSIENEIVTLVIAGGVSC